MEVSLVKSNLLNNAYYTHTHYGHISLCVSEQGYKQRKGFIIAQAPIKSTSRDFWKMVHERECSVIVMLSDLVENGEVGRTELFRLYILLFSQFISLYCRRCVTSTGLLITPRGCRGMENSRCLFSKPQNRKMASYNAISASPTPR